MINVKKRIVIIMMMTGCVGADELWGGWLVNWRGWFRFISVSTPGAYIVWRLIFHHGRSTTCKVYAMELGSLGYIYFASVFISSPKPSFSDIMSAQAAFLAEETPYTGNEVRWLSQRY